MSSDLTATPFVLDPSNSVKHVDRNTGADTDAGSNPPCPQAPDGYVAKQAGARSLRTTAQWSAKPEGARPEAAALRICHRLTPNNTPRLVLDQDPDAMTLTTTSAPPSWQNWKSMLFDPGDDRAVGPGTHSLYTALDPHEVILTWPRHDITALLASFAAAGHLLIHAATSTPSPSQTHATGRRRCALAGELGGVAYLEPGEELSVAYRLTVNASPCRVATYLWEKIHDRSRLAVGRRSAARRRHRAALPARSGRAGQ